MSDELERAADASVGEWGALAPRWERGRELLGKARGAVSEWLVEKLDPQPGQTILDLAAGTGDTGFLAAPRLEPGGRLISGDRRVGHGRSGAAARGGARARERRLPRLDAERLELDDASVDGVLNRFGYILKGDPPPALREIRRVLRPGGRLASRSGRQRELNPWMTVPVDVMVERGHLDPPGEAEQRLSARRNPESIVRLLDEAGFGRAVDRAAPGGLPLRRRRRALVLRQRAARPGRLASSSCCAEAERAAIRQEVEKRTPRADGGFELGGLSVNVVVS